MSNNRLIPPRDNYGTCRVDVEKNVSKKSREEYQRISDNFQKCSLTFWSGETIGYTINCEQQKGLRGPFNKLTKELDQYEHRVEVTGGGTVKEDSFKIKRNW